LDLLIIFKLSKEFEFGIGRRGNHQQYFTTLGDGCGARRGKSNDIMQQR